MDKGFIVIEDICNKFNDQMKKLRINIPKIDDHFPDFALEELKTIAHDGHFRND